MIEGSIMEGETLERDEPIKEMGNSSLFEKGLLQIATKFYGRMNVSMEAAKCMMDDVKDILTLSCEFFKNEFDKVAAVLTPDNKKLLQNTIDSSTTRILNILESMNTEHKVTTALKAKGVLQLPKKVVYNEKVIQIDSSFQTVKAEATVLPIANQIKTFLEKPKVLETIMNFQCQMENVPEGQFVHFLSGKVWKDTKSKFEGKDVIPIFLYNDDFGPDDGLGPHGPANKISAYYYK